MNDKYVNIYTDMRVNEQDMDKINREYETLNNRDVCMRM